MWKIQLKTVQQGETWVEQSLCTLATLTDCCQYEKSQSCGLTALPSYQLSGSSLQYEYRLITADSGACGILCPGLILHLKSYICVVNIHLWKSLCCDFVCRKIISPGGRIIILNSFGLINSDILWDNKSFSPKHFPWTEILATGMNTTSHYTYTWKRPYLCQDSSINSSNETSCHCYKMEPALFIYW